MMLDEYRTRVIDRLKTCRDTAEARSILAEADFLLMNSRVTKLTQDKFWETLNEVLDALAQEAKSLPDREPAVKLSAIVAAAQARIAYYRERKAGD
jgi:hypothetical protein